MNPPLVTLVLPVFNERAVLPELWRRLAAVFAARGDCRWSAVFVDDGSSDGSADWLRTLGAADPRVRVVELSRNFGHQPALAAGLHAATGCDAVVTLDADLQDPPELIPEMIDAWRAGAGVVLAVRRSRREHGLRRLGFDSFHRVFASLTNLPVTANTGTFGLMDAQALAAFNALPERHRFFPGLRAWIGFRCADVFYDRQDRFAGTPGQTLRRLVRYALDGIFSFSHIPLRIVTYMGLLVAGGGFAIGVFFVFRRLLGQEIAFTGFTTLVTLMMLIGGVQLVAIGVLGEYLGRVYEEVKRRPLYVLKEDARRP
jgi:glycosyltransferase involved in cell wall biosynthesis